MNDYDTDSSNESSVDRRTKRRRVKETLRFLAAAAVALASTEDPPSDSCNSTSKTPRTRAPRSGKSPKFFVKDATGNLVEMSPQLSPWYMNYVENPNSLDPKFLKKFRRRFRVPFSAFISLLDMVKSPENQKYFGRWFGGTPRQQKAPSVPIELLCLGALRYLGRGWTFDDLEENTGIDEETNRQFFHKFIDWGSEVLFKHYVEVPSSSNEARSTEYEAAGMIGCIGSMDATHILAEKILHDLKQEHTARKLHGTARTYNIVTNHRRKILCTTKGHPARWNDKTLVKYDELATTLRYGKNDKLDNFPFKLLQRNSEGEVIEVEYRGAWLLVDNGYLNWSCTVPPIKISDNLPALEFSEWVESLRKDVECTFGILKGRWRILKAGVRLHGIKAVDKVWLTCCALHNLLLENDGRLETDEWLTELGDFDDEDIEQAIPQAITNRILQHGDIRRFDSSDMGRGNDYCEDLDDDESQADSPTIEIEQEVLPEAEKEYLEKAKDDKGIIRVRLLPLSVFRNRLIENFDILQSQGKVKWPGID